MNKPSEGRPIARRFVIKRHAVTTSTKNPWVLRDRQRPHYLGHYARHDLAIAAVDRKLADERGYVPSVAEIREAMAPAHPSRHDHAWNTNCPPSCPAHPRPSTPSRAADAVRLAR